MANDSTRKRRNQRMRRINITCALHWFNNLPDEIVSSLMHTPHPKLSGDLYEDVPHSLWTYVMWLCQHDYENKARKIVYANTSSN